MHVQLRYVLIQQEYLAKVIGAGVQLRYVLVQEYLVKVIGA